MYHWVTDKDFVKRSYSMCSDLVNQLVQNLKKNNIDSAMNVVGSKKRNMILQNENEEIDFDFNILIRNADAFEEKELKQMVKRSFDEVLARNGMRACEDSTAVLTTKTTSFKTGNRTKFHIDVCLVKRDRNGQLHRLIHEKNGNTWSDRYYWNLVSDSKELKKKEDALKPAYWSHVRKAYLEKKNMYLKRPDDHNHPSFVCYVEAVNEVYEKKRRGTLC